MNDFKDDSQNEEQQSLNNSQIITAQDDIAIKQEEDDETSEDEDSSDLGVREVIPIKSYFVEEINNSRIKRKIKKIKTKRKVVFRTKYNTQSLLEKNKEPNDENFTKVKVPKKGIKKKKRTKRGLTTHEESFLKAIEEEGTSYKEIVSRIKQDIDDEVIYTNQHHNVLFRTMRSKLKKQGKIVCKEGKCFKTDLEPSNTSKGKNSSSEISLESLMKKLLNEELNEKKKPNKQKKVSDNWEEKSREETLDEILDVELQNNQENEK